MPHYAASYVPLAKEAQVWRWDPSSRRKPVALTVTSALALKSAFESGDHLWLMMGSTNAMVALGAFRRGVHVHQVSFSRVQKWYSSNGNGHTAEGESEEEEQVGRKTKISPSQVLHAAQDAPEIFYSVSTEQGEALEIASQWQRVSDAMEARKAAANLLRIRTYHEAVVYGRVRGTDIPADPTEAEEALENILCDLLDTRERDKDGKLTGRKRKPGDPYVAFLVEQEERERVRLEKLCRESAFYQYLFGSVEGVGPMIGSRIVAAVERIERFATAKDLSNYAGMLPRGKEGRLPSRKRSKGQTLSRSPRLNTTAFLLQDQLFQWGRNTELGQRLISQVERECPCKAEQRKADKDLARKHMEAVKRARVATTRYFLEHIVWPRWREYMGLGGAPKN